MDDKCKNKDCSYRADQGCMLSGPCIYADDNSTDPYGFHHTTDEEV
jgi:hypothetical protein